MVGKILIDTNVLLDYLLEREPFFEDAKKVISSCTEGNTKGCIAAHSISNMFFILRKVVLCQDLVQVKMRNFSPF